MFRSISTLLVASIASSVAAYTVVPLSYGIGTSPDINGLSRDPKTITLSPSSPLVTLDYGSEVFGFPTLEICALSGPTQIELKYTEEFAGLNSVYGDGPWTFANGLSNTFRTETLEITNLGPLQSFFLQGGLRWQSISLLTNTSVTLSSIGLQTESPIVPTSQLPGSFKSSDTLHNPIWSLGGIAVQAACVESGSAKSTWEITHDGALIRGQQTAQSVNGFSYSNYTMSFLTKIVRGGTGWRVASPPLPYGPYFVLTSNYPEGSTFTNTDKSLLPPNSLVVGYGWSIVNQSTLASGPVYHYSVSVPIIEDEWYEVSTAITPEGYQIFVNETHVTTISYAEALALYLPTFSSPSPTTGTWGFGPFQDQIAYVKNVKVTASNGSLLYENSMTSEDVLTEYGINSNDASVCLDGSKRDRLVWIGDFVHTVRTVAASTYRLDFITGTLGFEFARQIESGKGIGFVPTAAAMGGSAVNKNVYYPSSYGITDYQLFFLVTIGDYHRVTGDTATAKRYWTGTKLLVETMLNFIDPVSGLMAGATAFYFTGPVNGTAPSSLMVLALRQLVLVAEAVQDGTAAASYKAAADTLSAAINRELWNEQLGTYSLSTTSPGNFSAAGIAFAIRAGVANATQAASSISKLPLLKYGVGYVSDTTVIRANDTQLSPNILGFLLESLFIANTTLGVKTLDVAKDLLDTFWSHMVTQNEYYTGASWEYLYPDGSPGIGLFTSLSHPWGSAPTYLLPQYVLGISAVEAGYKTWQFKPLVYGLGLTDAQGTVPTPFGPISAFWTFAHGRLTVEVKAPSGTTGVISLPFAPSSCSTSGSNAHVVGQNVTITGGSTVEVVATV